MLLPYPLPVVWAHVVVGAAAGVIWGWLHGVAWEAVPLVSVTGAAALPAALLLTPVPGSRWRRAVRFGVSLAVILTLVSSFATPEELRSLERFVLEFTQFAVGGFLFFVLVVPRGRPELLEGGESGSGDAGAGGGVTGG